MRSWILAAVCSCVSAQPVPAPPTPEDILHAVHANDLATLRTAAIRKTAATARDPHHATVLMQAAAFGSLEAVRLLLDAGVPVNARNDFDATALLWAAGDPAKVKLLVAEGADVNAKSKLGRTPLMAAAAEPGNSETVALLLARGADAKAVDSNGGTALMDAARAGDAKSVHLLLAAGADPNHKDGLGWSPLMTAAQGGNEAAIRELLAKGADPKHANEIAPQVKFGPIAMQHMTALMLGTPFNSAGSVKAQLDAGGNVNARDVRGMTPLMLAAATEREDVARIRALLAGGADVTVKDGTGATALDWAERYGFPATVAALKAANAPTGDPWKAPVRPETKARSVREAMDAATSLLSSTSTQFFKQSGCVGCHNQPMAMAALSAAQKAGAKGDAAAIHSFTQMFDTGWMTAQEGLLQRMDPPGAPDGDTYSAWALSLTGYKPSLLTEVVAFNVAGQQTESGCWHLGDISRAPVQESDIARTARAALLLDLYASPALRPQTEARIQKARACLLSTPAVTTDDRALQLAGARWTHAGPDKIRELGEALLKLQREDGGWAQNPYLDSDAYATGQALWALRETGILAADSPAARRAADYLLRTQWPDGSWYVRSRAPKIQPYFQSGFPFGHDQWVSSAATAWAVIGLSSL